MQAGGAREREREGREGHYDDGDENDLRIARSYRVNDDDDEGQK